MISAYCGKIVCLHYEHQQEHTKQVVLQAYHSRTIVYLVRVTRRNFDALGAEIEAACGILGGIITRPLNVQPFSDPGCPLDQPTHGLTPVWCATRKGGDSCTVVAAAWHVPRL